MEYFDSFYDHIREKAERERIPITGALELTGRCNLKCVHCYSPGCVTKQDELCTTKDVLDILDALVQEGVINLVMTGGEPLLRKDFEQIYVHARRSGLMVEVFTNGTLISPSVADVLSEFPPKAVEISLYGATRETYEAVTRASGYFNNMLRGIQLLIERDVPVKLKTMLLTINKHELWKMKKLADELGVPFKYDPMISPMLDGSGDPLKYRLPPEEVINIDSRFPGMMEHMIEEWPRQLNDALPSPFYPCSAGLTTFYITSTGELCFCMRVLSPRYSLRNISFREAWQSMAKVREQIPEEPYACAQCRLLPVCGACIVQYEMDRNHDYDHIDYRCQIARLRDNMLSGQGASNDSVECPSVVGRPSQK